MPQQFKSSILVELEFGDVGLCGGGNLDNPEKNTPRTNKNTQPTYETGLESNPAHIGGRLVLSPLHLPYSP